MLRTKSLTARILTPLVLSATVSALLVAWMSWRLGHRWAMAEMFDRYWAIRTSLQHSNYPLKQPVLETLSQLTDAHWIAFDEDGEIQATTISLSDPAELPDSLYSVTQKQAGIRSGQSVRAVGETVADPQAAIVADPQAAIDVTIESSEFFAYRFDRNDSNAGSDETAMIVVLFDKDEVNEVAKRAAFLPLITGLSTIGLVSMLMFSVVSRLIGRLRRLESKVQQIAQGDFHSEKSDERLEDLTDGGGDEVGRLAEAINRMADQLSVLWNRVNQQQSSKLLHQVSGGMAHQLRNTLTGAKMAMELHQGKLGQESSDEVRVAIRQLEIAEDYVSRLLAIGNRSQADDRPQSVCECLNDVRSTHDPIAAHLRVVLRWAEAESIRGRMVKDGPSFSAAVSNLLLNAMQAGRHIDLTTRCDDDGFCFVTITDDGPGVDESVSQDLFEPFVTSKPEGLGLGLPLVRRTATQLGGEVVWRRDSGRTVFELSVATIKQPDTNQTECSSPASTP